MAKFLTKNDVNDYNDLGYKDIEVWGGLVRIRVMNTREHQEFLDFIEKKPNDKDFNLFLVKKYCLDENFHRLFNDDDDALLEKKSSKSLLKICKEILEINQQKENSVEELAKNS